MLAAKDEAAAAALRQGPDSKMVQEKVEEEEDEAPAKNKADVKEAEDRDGIYASFLFISLIHVQLQALNLSLSHQ